MMAQHLSSLVLGVVALLCRQREQPARPKHGAQSRDHRQHTASSSRSKDIKSNRTAEHDMDMLSRLSCTATYLVQHRWGKALVG